jgi:hypothetical protein
MTARNEIRELTLDELAFVSGGDFTLSMPLGGGARWFGVVTNDGIICSGVSTSSGTKTTCNA